MFTLSRAKRAMGAAGEPVPDVFTCLAERKAHIRRGQLHLIASAPGVGKTIFAQTLAIKAGVPALYFSADSDAFTMYLRGAAVTTGHSLSDIEADYNAGKGTFYDTHLDRLEHVRWDFTSNPDAADLEACVNAFAATFGEYPHLVIVDNLLNVDGADLAPEGKSQSGAVLAYLKSLAQETNGAVVALAHLTGHYDNGTEPAPLSALMDKVSKLPEVVLTLHRDTQGGQSSSLCVAIVKNRGGEADPSGRLTAHLKYTPAYAGLEDF